MKKIDALDKKGNFRHQQHTEKFYKELNSPKNKELQPFRYTDDIMVVGKHKGKHLSDLPKNYIKWLVKNYKGLSKSSEKILTQYLYHNL